MNKVIDFFNKNLIMNDVIVIGVSTGADSMCLLHLLLSLKNKLKLSIVCSHINHNKREQSKEEELFLKEFCEKENIIFESLKIEEYPDDNFHKSARDIRYKFYEDLIKKYNARILMTAHHADDLMETILMRITRGSSFNGYRGFDEITEKENYLILRPLMSVTKDEILKYNEQNNIKFYNDDSNDTDDYTRNRFRHHVLDFLKTEDEKVHLKFLKFHKTIDEYYKFIMSITNEMYKEVVVDNKIDVQKFNDQLELIKHNILEKYLDNIYGDDIVLINDKHTKSIENIIAGDKPNAYIDLPNKKQAKRNYNIFEIVEKEAKKADYKIELNSDIKLSNGKEIKFQKNTETKSNNYLKINSKEIKLPLWVRNRQNGDKIGVKNMSGTKKVNDIFTECKIATDARDSWPIVTDGDDVILWIPGLKKSKFDKENNEEYDIILKCEQEEEKYK